MTPRLGPLRQLADEGLDRLEDVVERALAGDHRPRSVESHRGRGHIEVRGVHRPGREGLAEEVERALEAHGGVRWAQVNPLLGLVAVGFDEDEVGAGELVGLVEGIEAARGVDTEGFASELSAHPADTGPIVAELVKLAADVGGLGVSLVAQAAHVAPLPIELASALAGVQSFPPVRRLLAERPRLAEGYAVGNALVHGLAQGRFGLANDIVGRAALVAELLARREAWLRLEPSLAGGPMPARLAAVAHEPRPAPLPPGRLDVVTARVTRASLGVGAATLALTGSLRRGANGVIFAAPRAAWSGTEAFASALGWRLARRDVLVVDPRVLRRLERVDTLVLDAGAVSTGRSLLGVPELVDRADPAQVGEALEGLFDADAPGALRRSGAWALGPPGRRRLVWPGASRDRWRALGRGGRRVLVLSCEGRVAALVATRPELLEGGHRLARAARDADLEVVLASLDEDLAGELHASRALPGGSAVARSVRALQAEGRVVALVSATSHAGLLAADLGIGVRLSTAPHPPWGAPVLCGSLLEAVSLLDAVRLARAATRRGLPIALAGSALAVLALNPGPLGSQRATQLVNLSSLLAAIAGTLTAAQLPAPPRPVAERPAWHALVPGDVLVRLDAAAGGLAETEAARRRPPPPPYTTPALVAAVGSELANPLTVLLGAGAAASAVAGSVIDAVLIAAAVGIDAAVGAVQRVRTEAVIERLSRLAAEGTMHVRRDGERRSLPVAALVPGDVVLLEAGDAVRADCRLLEASQLELDESSLTGESLPVAKSPEAVPAATPLPERRSMLYAGTSVAAGSATAVVVATGGDVEAERALEREVKPPPTGVEQRLSELSRQSVPFVLGSGAGLALTSLLRGRPAAEAVAAGVSLATAAVPEGLPFVATAAEAAAAKRLARRGVIVHNPSVLEALGRVDVLCFDKTGTLTEGRLVLRDVSDGRGEEPAEALGPRGRAVLGAALRASPRGRTRRLPHPTDQAIVSGAQAAGVTAGEGAESWRPRRVLPFEPGRSFHAALGATGSRLRLSVKGAPEVVLTRCTRWRQGRRFVPLSDHRRADLDHQLDLLARRGLRVLAVAEKTVPDLRLDEERIDGLDFVGFVACGDLARSSAEAPIAGLLARSVQVVMVTGDHPSTAASVAAELGMLNGRRVVTGPELDRLDDDALDALVGDVAVFARTTPANKVRIVRAFERAGKVVAMTGDGANDAQAIRLASVGIAFGPRATPAAREAADLVVTSDSVEALVEAIAEGRTMWGSVRESLAMLLGGNLGEAVFTTGTSLLTGQPGLSARQLLAVNLFTDLVPAMALAVQPSTPGAVEPGGEGPDVSLGGELVRQVVVRAAATAAGATAAWTAASLTGTAARARTVALAALVGGQLGQTLVVGRHSWLTVSSTLLSAGALVAVVEVPGVSRFFDCRPLGPLGWALALSGSAVATVGAVVADRLVPAASTASRAGATAVTGRAAAPGGPSASRGPQPMPAPGVVPRPVGSTVPDSPWRVARADATPQG